MLLEGRQRRGLDQPVDEEAGPADGCGDRGRWSAPERDLLRLAALVPGLGDLHDFEVVVAAVLLPVHRRVMGREHHRAIRLQNPLELGKRTWGPSSFAARYVVPMASYWLAASSPSRLGHPSLLMRRSGLVPIRLAAPTRQLCE